MIPQLTPSVEPIAYRVSILPRGHRSYRLYAIDVQMRGDRWAVVTGMGQCLGVDGSWDESAEPYGRGNDWLDAHRFTLDDALRLAAEAAPHVTINEETALEVL